MLLSSTYGGTLAEQSIAAQVSAIRAFNRFYTRKIGVVDGMASSPFSLAEARVLYELPHREQPTATNIRRILRDFERRKLVTRTDERQTILLYDGFSPRRQTVSNI